MDKPRKINVEGMLRLPAFCHVAIAGDTIYVSGTLGTDPETDELVAGGMAEQTRQTLKNIGAVLEAVGASFEHVAKMNVYITDMSQFGAMNEVYLEFFDGDPPARITVGCNALALGAQIEIDCIGYKKASGPAS